MNFRTELFLSLKYFKPRRNAVSVITLISVIGVSLGVCVLMVVIAIMTGFTDEIKTKLIDTRPHIEITNFERSYIKSPGPMIKRISAEGCVAIPRTEGEVLVQKGDDVKPQFLIGIDKDLETKADFISKNIYRGKFSLNNNEVIVSYILASQLKLRPGTKIIIHSPAKLKEMVKLDKNGNIESKNIDKVYVPSEFTVKGIYSMGEYSFDSSVIITNLDDADDIFGYPLGSCTKIAVNTKDPFNIEGSYNKISEMFPDYNVISWKQRDKQYLNVLAVEKNMMFFVLIFIVLVAASSITNTLITVVVQKTREIGLLRALGATPLSVMVIFILQGFYVGFLGTGVGLVLGSIVIHWRMAILHMMSNVFHMEIFPKQFYLLSQLPASVVTGDVVFISLCSIILCTVGALIPAFRAAKLDPAKALRYE